MIDTEKQGESLVLRTEGLVKRYGKRTVVNDVSINVKQGEIVGLLGPNGAGKTTSFYMTTGLIVPNEGHIYLNDQDITQLPVSKRARSGIGYLPQEASVFRKMSVEDNILSVLEMTGKPRSYQLEKLESLIAEFRLGKVRKNMGDQLSGGERRRTEIARCLAIDPKFIMLDEPFAGVDPIAVEDIQHIVWQLKDKNIGILITKEVQYAFLSQSKARNPPSVRHTLAFKLAEPYALFSVRRSLENPSFEAQKSYLNIFLLRFCSLQVLQVSLEKESFLQKEDRLYR